MYILSDLNNRYEYLIALLFSSERVFKLQNQTVQVHKKQMYASYAVHVCSIKIIDLRSLE